MNQNYKTKFAELKSCTKGYAASVRKILLPNGGIGAKDKAVKAIKVTAFQSAILASKVRYNGLSLSDLVYRPYNGTLSEVYLLSVRRNKNGYYCEPEAIATEKLSTLKGRNLSEPVFLTLANAQKAADFINAVYSDLTLG